jgi:hypothetical protein
MNRIKEWADGLALVFVVLTITQTASAATLSCVQSTLQGVAPSDTTIIRCKPCRGQPAHAWIL